MARSNRLRGSRLGTLSHENGDQAEAAPVRMTRYECACGKVTALPFSIKADEIPAQWGCGACGGQADREDLLAQPDAGAVTGPQKGTAKTHWEHLMERRTMAELEEIFEERLAILRASRKVA
jgi:hypothetical protein